MKKIICAMVLCAILSPACLAEASSTDRFLSNLSDTWDAFLDMAEDAGKGISKWAGESGVTEWAESRARDIAAWAKESGLTDWAANAHDAVTTWFDETGIAGWAEGTSREIQTFIEENRPAIEAWLAEAGQDVREAWATLVNADRHTDAEVGQAYATVTESLGEMAEE